MLDFLTAYIFKQTAKKQSSAYGNEVDRYIANKNPQTVADVEHWEKEYARKKQTRDWAI